MCHVSFTSQGENYFKVKGAQSIWKREANASLSFLKRKAFRRGSSSNRLTMRPSPERRPSPSRRSRMSNGVSPGQGPPHQHQRYSPPQNYAGPQPQQRRSPQNGAENGVGNGHGGDGPTPICRCRVLYLGSAVPHVTKDGLQGIQEPLKELYPEDGALGAKGIDSWLSVWSNGFLLENMDENRKKVTRFFPVESLHYCAAVRYVLVPGTSSGDKVKI